MRQLSTSVLSLTLFIENIMRLLISAGIESLAIKTSFVVFLIDRGVQTSVASLTTARARSVRLLALVIVLHSVGQSAYNGGAPSDW